MTTLKIAAALAVILSTVAVSGDRAEARGWAWFVKNTRSGPHCSGRPTTYYGEGRRNADGSAFNKHGLSAASVDYPFGTVLRVTNCANGRSVDVTVKDRGPGTYQRALGIRLDLSTGAARQIALGQNGRFESGWTSASVVSMGSGAVYSARERRHRGGRRIVEAQAMPVDRNTATTP